MNDLLLCNGRVADVRRERLVAADVVVSDGRISAIVPRDAGGGASAAQPSADAETIDLRGMVLAPGLIDAHVHIESSMLAPVEFAKAALAHGTTSVFVDPHEIANVCGRAGVEFFIESAATLPIDLFVGLPSCVPATHLEDAGGVIGLQDIEEMLPHPAVYGLAEMMNFPGIIHGLGDAREKVACALAAGKLADGHCPQLSGADLATYVSNGACDGVVRISSDHECTTAEEAVEKLDLGMTVAVREGSAARDLAALLPRLVLARGEQLDRVMLCSDDLDPIELLHDGHMDRILRRASVLLRTECGLDMEAAGLRALRLATLNPATHYGQARSFGGAADIGEIRVGGRANLVVFRDLEHFGAERVFVDGRQVWHRGAFRAKSSGGGHAALKDTMNVGRQLASADFAVPVPAGAAEASAVAVRCIDVTAACLLTGHGTAQIPARGGRLCADPGADLAKLAVIERHCASGTQCVGFVRGLGLKQGALASTVAHDSHNLIVAGVDDESMATAANAVIAAGGGVAVAVAGAVHCLPLPVGGLMSDLGVDEVACAKESIIAAARQTGSPLANPLMTLSFLALPVIPELKMTNRGLVDVNQFEFVPLLV